MGADPALPASHSPHFLSRVKPGSATASAFIKRTIAPHLFQDIIPAITAVDQPSFETRTFFAALSTFNISIRPNNLITLWN